MKEHYSIITPTYGGHFCYIRKYLASAARYIIEPQNITIYFTINANEMYSFAQIIAPYQKRLNIKVILFEDILKHYSIYATPQQLLERYGRFSFQTLKKFYTILYTQSKYSLVLDSESMWIRPVNMGELFKEYFTNPYISFSEPNPYLTSPFLHNVMLNINYLLDSAKCNKWFLENFVWFYDLTILQELIDKHGTPIQMVEYIYQLTKNNPERPGVFEIALYHQYLYLNAEKYHYNVINIEEECRVVLDKEQYYLYLRRFYERFQGSNGLAEQVMLFLNRKNWRAFAKVFKENKYLIIRCEESGSNYRYQKKFINKVKPCILAASQNHRFGGRHRFSFSHRLQMIKTPRLRSFLKKCYFNLSPLYRQALGIREKLDVLNERSLEAAACISKTVPDEQSSSISYTDILLQIGKVCASEKRKIYLFTDLTDEFPFCVLGNKEMISALDSKKAFALIAYRNVFLGESVAQELFKQKINYKVLFTPASLEDYRIGSQCASCFRTSPLFDLELIKKYYSEIQILNMVMETQRNYLEIGIWEEERINFLTQYISYCNTGVHKLIFYDVKKEKCFTSIVKGKKNSSDMVFHKHMFLENMDGKTEIRKTRWNSKLLEHAAVCQIRYLNGAFLKQMLWDIHANVSGDVFIMVDFYNDYEYLDQVRFVVDNFLDETKGQYVSFVTGNGAMILKAKGKRDGE